MTNTFTKYLCTTLLGMAILSSCSRPVAYFQRGPIEPLATAEVELPQMETAPTELMAKANATLTEVDAYIRNDSKLAVNEKLAKRMKQAKMLLMPTHGTLESKAVIAPHKMNVVERLMIRKINKQINRQLAPNHSEKTMANPVILIGGIVLLIGGLILLIAGTGTAAFIGLILALIGALGTILGLFGQ
ncbi:hypothetical protein [Spirosoma telluris]